MSSLKAADPAQDIVLMCEVMSEATYVQHHIKKIAFVFSAMRHFRDELRGSGWNVEYVHIDDPDNQGDLTNEVERALKRYDCDRVLVTEPGEWRLRELMKSWSETWTVPVTLLPDERFLCSHAEFDQWADGRKQLRMEYFYREMRRKTGLLMEGDKPVGGKWNYDADNRKPAKADLFLPVRHDFPPDTITEEVLQAVEARFGQHFGELRPFGWATSRADAEQARNHFLADCLPSFGDYQDAMLTDSPFLYHALLAPYINAGLLDPLDLCRRVEAEYRAGRAPLNAVEGFIRQIIGWREYVRGIYWRFMPDYLEQNFLQAQRPLPAFYWSGDTELACLRAVIAQTRKHAYAHHIQRLMITGTFAMLAGVDPKAVHEWYLAVYADAYEWVELPNTLGMSQFADGGLLGSKPYAASGNYINRMSDYCASCRYDVKKKIGEDACPFNALYWHFIDRHDERLRSNPRMGQIYRSWDKMDETVKAETLQSAEAFLAKLS